MRPAARTAPAHAEDRNPSRHWRGAKRHTPLALATLLALGSGPVLPASATFAPNEHFEHLHLRKDWHFYLNWDTQHVPGLADNAWLQEHDVDVRQALWINSFTGTGTLTTYSPMYVAAASSIGRLALYANLSGTNSLTASKLSYWSGGTIASTNSANFVTAFNGGLEFATNQHVLDRTSMFLGGVSGWTGGDIVLNRSFITNQGSFQDWTAANVSLTALTGSDSFYNSGLYQKFGSSQTSIHADFVNNGTLWLDRGTMTLTRGVSFTDAETGPGAVKIWNGAVLKLGASSTIGSLELKNGTLIGTGNVTVSNHSSWSEGTLSLTEGASGNVSFNGGLALMGTSARSLQRSVTLSGLSAWTGGGLTFSSGAVLTNNGSFSDTVTTSGTLGFVGAGTSFINNGTYSKLASGTSIISVPFVNNGSLVVKAGLLRFNGGMTSHPLSSVTLTGGTLWADARTIPFSIAKLHINGGTLNGAGQADVSLASTWTSGTMTGPNGTSNRTKFLGGLAIGGSDSKSLGHREVSLYGASSWAGNGSITFDNAAVLMNMGVFTDQNSGAASSIDSGLGINSFVNRGHYAKTGAGTTTIGTSFINNLGSLDVQAGTLDLAGGLLGFSGSTLSHGSYVVSGSGVLKFADANIVTNATAITLDGSAARIQSSNDGSNALANFASITTTGRFTLLNGATFAAAVVFTNAGQLSLGLGSGFTPKVPTTFVPTFTNSAGATVQMQGGILNGAATNAGTISGHGRLNGSVANNGTVRASGGTLTAGSLNGNVIVDAGATLALIAATTLGTLTQAGTLAIGASSISISKDYDNAAFGVGNAFNRRAGVTGSGKILATGGVKQTLSGEFVTLGDTASAVLTLPSVRVGAAPLATSFKINNVGSSGSSLRGAIQASGMSARLSGSGVTAQNWGAVAAGASSGSYDIVYQPLAGQSLTGQTLAIVNNFDNVAGQTLSITGGKVYTPALAQLGGTTLDFGIVHVGDTVAARTITVGNTATRVAGLNDVLLAAIRSDNARFTPSGSVAGLAAGAQDPSSLQVSLDTSYSGQSRGTATLAFASHNADMSDLALASQQVVLKAQVNHYAELGLGKLAGAGSFSGGGAAYTLDFGTLRLGSGTVGAELVVSNVAPGMSDLLGLKFDLGTAGSHFSLSGFGPIAGLGEGDYQDGLKVSFSGLLAGHFDEVVTLHAIGSNASGYMGALGDVQLRLVGEVAAVPEPATWAQFGLGLAGLAGFLARRRMGRRESVDAGR